MANKFKKGDQVIIIAGTSKGKEGKILSIAKDRVVVEGVNIATIHKKPTQQNPGQILKIEKPLNISNISHVEDGKPVKVKFVIESGEGKIFARKYRVSKKSGKKIGN
ncbi:MAG: 50S ribosomal protein L24 [Alphaproteobacteria bacterium RIFCSPLOWO2_01_FULL_40_26]|nr:MAG: 50S ribosomal protein L24 [Alphaproteobacteria bacterium RIFCSPHIGHO2_02_FULL_40_34]OFW87852.1 MAG: 50S ribosomal protein L24 [Alphaproteobacteria bacterium RIFCSPHIGHO2_01_FULL_40_8]OFW95087.1 MAG: 50S ribosomal protein L24 [Alphaproteobacteria bacterium RIFCSPLOWO2_01_FULL_40_26]OFX09090.1 MAG: 50S ribosomal protein L24 [Alphaproteobacteria bacterium RIFCSPLOWO2_02_FULL_40_19]OFX12168.1 MAG: 50S ribosomal protein L24 [Alphaproteobacteria bacterium RIFCSPLOWO2_12_FULL_40_11]